MCEKDERLKLMEEIERGHLGMLRHLKTLGKKMLKVLAAKRALHVVEHELDAAMESGEDARIEAVTIQLERAQERVNQAEATYATAKARTDEEAQPILELERQLEELERWAELKLVARTMSDLGFPVMVVSVHDLGSNEDPEAGDDVLPSEREPESTTEPEPDTPTPSRAAAHMYDGYNGGDSDGGGFDLEQ